MFKRANKITALLVAAASVMSIVPAMAADTTRLGNKEGTIKQGIAFGDGSYSYYGYRTDDDDTGIYYNNDGGSKDKFNDDLEDYRFNNDSKYGEKYAYAQENSNDDEYLVDLSTGKIVDDETAEEKLETAKSKFVSQIKKADRYEGLIEKTSEFDTLIDANDGSFDQILKGQFGEVWYQFSVTTSAGAEISYTDVDGNPQTVDKRYIGFTNESGKYIDLSQETNLRVFSTKTGRAEYIKEYSEKDKDAQLTVDLIDVKPIAQDKDYIYTLTTVKVTDDNAATVVADAIADGATAAEAALLVQPEVQFFVQKISKAQGGKDDDDAYAAKSIDSYQLQAKDVKDSAGNVTVRNEIYDEGDFGDAYEKLITADSTEKLLGVVVKDSTLYVYAAKLNNAGDESDKLQVWKLKLGKFKKETKVGTNLDKDVDTYAVKKDGDTDNGDIVDFEMTTSDEDAGIQGLEQVVDRKTKVGIQLAGRDLYRLPSVSFDTEGNVWALEKGKVLKYTGTDKKTVYTVDRAMTAIDAYDEKNILIWDVDGDVYTNISEGQKKTEEDGLDVNPDLGKTEPAKVGWDKLADGAWNFYDATGAKVANNWVNVGGAWYYLKADGTMATGWQQVGGTWYYLNASGSMATGWVNSNGTWYYLQSSGAMKTGWLNDNGTWYYLNASGAMLANTTVDGYKLGASGAWVK